MGIINITPDSFSDGSQLGRDRTEKFEVDSVKALARAREMVKQGAVFLDVGGESTRPGAEPVSVQEELDRVIPVIEAIHADLDVNISVDTSSPEVMLAAISAGVVLINDIRALTRPGAVEVVAASDVAVCLMHMQGQPKTMQQQTQYNEVTETVVSFLRERVEACVQAGVDRSQLLLDPGFGFGKSLEQNYRLLKNLADLKQLDLPILVGISRKSMIGEVVQRPVTERLAGSIAATTYALQAGALVIRTHDVAATIDAIRVNSAFSNA